MPIIKTFGLEAEWLEEIVRPPLPLAHSNKICEVLTGQEDLTGFDGIWTSNKNLTLGMTSADCGVVCFYSDEKIGISHAGWRGLCAGICEDFIQVFKDENPEIWVAPLLPRFEIQRDFCFEQIQNKFGNNFFFGTK